MLRIIYKKVIDCNDDGHEKRHTCGRQIDTALNPGDEIGVEILFTPEPCQHQVGLLIHETEQNAAHETLCHIPVVVPEGKIHGDGSDEFYNYDENCEGVSAALKEEIGNNTGNHSKYAGCQHEIFIEENRFTFFFYRNIIAIHITIVSE